MFVITETQYNVTLSHNSTHNLLKKEERQIYKLVVKPRLLTTVIIKFIDYLLLGMKTRLTDMEFFDQMAWPENSIRFREP